MPLIVFENVPRLATRGRHLLDGLSDSDWRERIGNAVPPAAAEAIAHVMGTTLLLAEQGETFMLSAMPIWVRPVAVGLSVAQPGPASSRSDRHIPR